MYRGSKTQIAFRESRVLPMPLTFRNNSRWLASGQVTRCANYPRGGCHLNWINSPHFFSGPVEGQLMMNATEWNGIGWSSAHPFVRSPRTGGGLRIENRISWSRWVSGL